jgi:hypothetical protein
VGLLGSTLSGSPSLAPMTLPVPVPDFFPRALARVSADGLILKRFGPQWGPMMDSNPPPARLSFLAASILLGSALATGCVAVVPYQPDESVVTKMGPEEAKRKLSDILSRATIPHVSAVNVTDDFVEYEWQQSVPGPFFAPIVTANKTQIRYVNIGRIELYANNYVFVWWPGDQRRDEICFATPEEAKQVADLLMSFRAARSKP